MVAVTGRFVVSHSTRWATGTMFKIASTRLRCGSSVARSRRSGTILRPTASKVGAHHHSVARLLACSALHRSHRAGASLLAARLDRCEYRPQDEQTQRCSGLNHDQASAPHDRQGSVGIGEVASSGRQPGAALIGTAPHEPAVLLWSRDLSSRLGSQVVWLEDSLRLPNSRSQPVLVPQALVYRTLSSYL